MKNTKGGKKHKKQGNVSQDFKKLTLADEEQKYGKVTKILGNSRFEICVYSKNKKNEFTSQTITGVARIGLKKKRMFISNGCYVIVSLRDFQINICDIVHVYKDIQIYMLVKKGMIPSNDSANGEDEFNFEDTYEEEEPEPEKIIKIKNEPYFILDIEVDETEYEEKEYDDYGNALS
tara:strand:- start:941 stop:1471 length:531 start_codon:yes stop_codon:yes gene_type:complete